jgi:hypothetical protein
MDTTWQAWPMDRDTDHACRDAVGAGIDLVALDLALAAELAAEMGS